MSQQDKFTREEIELLVADKEFEAKLNADELLERLLNEPEKPLHRERFESLCFLADGGVVIAGIELPPPTPGVWLLLTMIDCPFVAADNDRDMNVLDFFRAMFIIKYGREAVLPLLPYQALKAELATLADQAEQSDGRFALYLNKIGELSAAWANFNQKVLAFAEQIGSFDYLKATDELENYLSAALAAFDLLPRRENKKKTTGTKSMRLLLPDSWLWLLKLLTPRRSRCSGTNPSPESASSPLRPSKKTAQKVSENAKKPMRQSPDSKS